MIITILLQFAASFISGLQNLLSGGASLDSHITSSITFILDSINGMSYLIPVSSLFSALAIVVGFEFVLWGFRGGVWIYRHIPFIGH